MQKLPEEPSEAGNPKVPTFAHEKATAIKRQTSMLLNERVLSAANMFQQVSHEGNIEDSMTTNAENLEDTAIDTMTTAVNTSCETLCVERPGGVSQVELGVLRSRLQVLERHLVTELAAGGPENLVEKLVILKSGFDGLERVNRRS